MNDSIPQQDKKKFRWLPLACFACLTVGLLGIFVSSRNSRIASDAELAQLQSRYDELERLDEAYNKYRSCAIETRRDVTKAVSMARSADSVLDPKIDRIVAAKDERGREITLWIPAGKHTLFIDAHWKTFDKNPSSQLPDLRGDKRFSPEHFEGGSHQQWRIELQPNSAYKLTGVDTQKAWRPQKYQEKTPLWHLFGSAPDFENRMAALPIQQYAKAIKSANYLPSYRDGQVTEIGFPSQLYPKSDLLRSPPYGVKVFQRLSQIEFRDAPGLVKANYFLVEAEVHSEAPPCLDLSTAMEMAKQGLGHFLDPVPAPDGRCLLNLKAIERARQAGETISIPSVGF